MVLVLLLLLLPPGDFILWKSKPFISNLGNDFHYNLSLNSIYERLHEIEYNSQFLQIVTFWTLA